MSENLKENLFNIYYINFPKVYELKMMLSNVIALSQEITEDNFNEKAGFLKAKLGFNLMDLFKVGDIEGGGSLKSNNSSKVFETFEIKTTKSIILNEIYSKARTIVDFQKMKEGQLVKLENIELKLMNEVELRTIKLINSGAFKGISIPEAKGLDINNIFNSMFKDYAYKIIGKNNKIVNQNLIIKIPLTFENEFESSYGIDDLFIGRVTVIGIYKGLVTVDKLKNSFEYFQQLGDGNLLSNNNSYNDEVEESQYELESITKYSFFEETKDDNKYHYIDLLSIVQKVEL